MRKVDALFREYAAFHRDPRNKACHYVGITIIVLSLLSLLSLVRIVDTAPVPFDLAAAVALATVAYYVVLDAPLGIGAALVLSGLWLAGQRIAWPVAAGLFVFGWILQFVGHAFEGKRPAFTRNAVHLLVGPLWILSHLYEKAGLRKPAEAGAAGAQA